MALDSTFAAAYIDNGSRYRILGQSLKPFCLWHVLLLQAIHSPFVVGGEATLFHLKNAIAVCRLQYRQSKIRRQIFPVFMPIRTLKKHVDRFMEYVGDYFSRPEYSVVPWDITNSKPQIHLTHPPAIVCVAYNAARGAGIPVKEAWNMPIGEAYISEAMFLREQGSQLDFMDDEEKEFQRQMKEAGLA